MKCVFALHGNPGHENDWRLLQQLAPQIKSVDAYSDAWIGEVLHSPEKVILIGHSWGAYRILKALPRISTKVEKVILVTPYVNIERPLSGLAKILLSTPWIGDRLIQANHKKNKDSFLNDLIYPFKIEGLPYYHEIYQRLQSWQLWQKTALMKIQMQSNPLLATDICETRIEVLYGNEDKISNATEQNKVIMKYPNIKIQNLNNMGHGLLWSHPELILKELT